MSDTESMIPPDDRNFVGGGDFKVIGESFLRHFVDVGGLKPDDAVLDVGCGIGRMAIPLTQYLSPQGNYEGFDIVPEGIAWCRERITPRYPNFRFQLADIKSDLYNPGGKSKPSRYRFPFKGGTFDFVFLTSVFTHLQRPEFRRYLAEVSRVLKPGKTCFISYFLLNPETDTLLRAGKSSIHFEVDLGGYRTINAVVPEEAIAYSEEEVRKAGRPPKEVLDFQDVIVATKRTARPGLLARWFG
jgi:ubiquinone/menaquinone biosynthesis C-methylase UbiE